MRRVKIVIFLRLRGLVSLHVEQESLARPLTRLWELQTSPTATIATHLALNAPRAPLVTTVFLVRLGNIYKENPMERDLFILTGLA